MAEGELDAERFAVGIAVGYVESREQSAAVDGPAVEEEPAAGDLQEASLLDVLGEGFHIAIVLAALEGVVVDLFERDVY